MKLSSPSIARLLNNVKVPLFLLILLAGFEILSNLGILPTGRGVSLFISQLLNSYGLIIVGPLAFFENLAAFNVYFPGSIVILTTMAVSAGNLGRATSIFFIYYLFAIPAYHVDYFLGKSLRMTKFQAVTLSSVDTLAHKNLWLRFLILFSHPQLASILCVQLGSENHKYSEIIKYLFLFTFVWTLFWSIVMYSYGTISGTGIDLKILAYIYLFGLLAYNIYKFLKQERNLSNE